ncbi:hypothetical protein [Neisseria dentiae]|uniref:hypothetical protein n=1 Tax=Neisseria dentiae TaxID=194197 RepID=UPI0035A0A014
MDTINNNVRITAAARFDGDSSVSGKTLKQALQQQTGTDARRFSRLSLLAALGACKLRSRAAVREDCAVYVATPFSSPSLFEKMTDNVLNHHAAMPFDFIANLHNAPAFHAAQALGSRGASLVLAADNRPESWTQILRLAADSLHAEGQIAVGWCYEQPQAQGGWEGSIWVLLEYARGQGKPGFADSLNITQTPSENSAYWQGVADWLQRLEAV